MKTNFRHPNLLYFTIGFIFFLLICALHISCGRLTVEGGTTHKVEGEAVIKVEVSMSMCDGLPEDARQECVMTIIDLLKKKENAS